MENLGDRQARALDRLGRQAVEELEQQAKGWSITDGVFDKSESANHANQYIEKAKELAKMISETISGNQDAFKRILTAQVVHFAFLMCNPRVGVDQKLEESIVRKINAAVLVDIELADDALSDGVIAEARKRALGSPPIIEAVYALAELDPEVAQIRTRAIAAVCKLSLKEREWGLPDDVL